MATDRIRTTISLDPEVHEIFKRMAEASGMSVSRAMGEWLADTAEGAEFVVAKMVEARKAPMVVMREMQALSKGLSVEVEKTMQEMRQANRQGQRSAPGGSRAASISSDAPSSNTGLNSPRKAKSRGG
jgi:hypothetical protein